MVPAAVPGGALEACADRVTASISAGTCLMTSLSTGASVLVGDLCLAWCALACISIACSAAHIWVHTWRGDDTQECC